MPRTFDTANHPNSVLNYNPCSTHCKHNYQQVRVCLLKGTFTEAFLKDIGQYNHSYHVYYSANRQSKSTTGKLS